MKCTLYKSYEEYSPGNKENALDRLKQKKHSVTKHHGLSLYSKPPGTHSPIYSMKNSNWANCSNGEGYEKISKDFGQKGLYNRSVVVVNRAIRGFCLGARLVVMCDWL
jgi:hypothetical protein